MTIIQILVIFIMQIPIIYLLWNGVIRLQEEYGSLKEMWIIFGLMFYIVIILIFCINLNEMMKNESKCPTYERVEETLYKLK